MADPPWWFNDQGSRATPYYAMMKDEEILAMPVADIVAPESHLYLWAPDAMILSGLASEVARRWGFDPKLLLHWFKRSPAYLEDGPMGEYQMGMGHYYRHASESVLFCARDNCPVLRHDRINVLEAPRRQHSEKPEELQDEAEIMSPGPYVELFARRRRGNWLCWGDEVKR